MATKVLFVQGGGGQNVHDQWDSKLVASLAAELGPDYDILYPRLPDEDNPKFGPWQAALRNELDRLEAGAMLVGHSIGATVLIHTLAAKPPRQAPAGIFLLAAPFIGAGGWPSDEIEPDPALGAKLPASARVYLYQGSADATVPPTHLELYARAIPQAVMRPLPGRDHQLNNDLAAVAADIRALVAG